jgi:four helix bundle protein
LFQRDWAGRRNKSNLVNLSVIGSWVLGQEQRNILIYLAMSSYKDLEIYKKAFDLSISIHHSSLKLPAFELYEQGSQIRRSSKGVRGAIVEGFGRRRYKADCIKYLTYAIASCDETLNHILSIYTIYPDIKDFKDIEPEYEILGRMINNYIQYVELNWNT